MMNEFDDEPSYMQDELIFQFLFEIGSACALEPKEDEQD